MCANTKPAQPQMNVVRENTYSEKTVVQTNDKTIKICKRTDTGSERRSFLESSNIMFALSIIQFFNLLLISTFTTIIFIHDLIFLTH